MARWKHPGVRYIPWEGELIQMPVELPRNAYVKDLKKVVAERMNVDPATVYSPLKTFADYSFYLPSYFQRSFINIIQTACFSPTQFLTPSKTT
jgi:hypothetical protein